MDDNYLQRAYDEALAEADEAMLLLEWELKRLQKALLTLKEGDEKK
jgi:hypothetical protein